MNSQTGNTHGALGPFPRRTLLQVGVLLLAVLWLAACAPAAASAPPPEPTALMPVLSATSTLAAVASPLPATQPAVPLPVATSRGPNLEATEPSTVRLDSGGLQLVEFFRFTWATCRAMAPMVHGLEAKYSGRIKFSYLDADDPRTEAFQRALGFRSQPELYLLDANGAVLKKFVGFQTQEGLEGVFAQFLQ